MDYIRQIEQANSRQMNALRPPHRKEVLKARENDIKEKVQNWMSKENEPRLQRIAGQLLEEYNDVELIASLLQELVEANDEVEVQLTFEKPLERKGRPSKGPRRNNNNKRGNKFDNKGRRGKPAFNKKGKKDKPSDRKDNKKSMKGRTFADHQK